MSLFSKIKQKVGITATDKLLLKEVEYALHEKVGKDLERGEKNLGVWTKAIAEVEGDEQKIEAKYIELMVQHLKDEIAAGAELAEILEEEHEKGMRMARERREAEQARTVSAPYDAIKKELAGKNIHVDTNFWGGGYNIEEPEGKEQHFETLSDLQEYYKKVMNK